MVQTPTSYPDLGRLQVFFAKAQTELRDANASVDELGFRSTNAIVDEIIIRFLVPDEQDPAPLLPEDYAPVPHPVSPTLLLPPQHAHVVTPTDPDVMTMIQRMQLNMNLIQSQMTNAPYAGTSEYQGGYRDRGRGNAR